ncbi:hypothetical protein Tco_0094704, partial [Tanacetum coccineum]
MWDIIANKDLEEEVALTGEQSSPPAPPAPKTAKQLTIKRNQERVKSVLLLAIPDEYLLKFHIVPDANLDKAYDRFQKLISQLEVHDAPVSKEDINQKFLRSLPPSWSQSALIMRNKPDIDKNLDFLSSENTSSTNEVSTAIGNFGVNTARGTNSSSHVSSTPG